MSIPTVTVTVNAYDQDGTALEGATVKAVLNGTDVYNNQIVGPITQTQVTDANGQAQLQLFPNESGTKRTYYRFTITRADGKKITDVAAIVPAASCNLSEIANNLREERTAPAVQTLDYTPNLQAFSSLVGAADKLPYFTGAAQLALADFTSVGRQLVAASTMAAASALLTGPFLAGDGSATAPAYSFSSSSNYGLFKKPSALVVAVAGLDRFAFTPASAAGFTLSNAMPITWSSALETGTTYDLALWRDAANTLALRNGTNPQVFHVYNSSIDGSNYERLAVRFTSNVAELASVAAGSGTVRALRVGTYGSASVAIRTNSADRWFWDGSGHYLAATDNTIDIGASGANRPRHLYLAGDARVNRDLFVTSNSTLGSQSSDTLTINAGTWTFGNRIVVSVSAGAIPNSFTNIIGLTATYTGDAGGNSSAVGFHMTTQSSGTANFNINRGFSQTYTHGGSGTVTQARGYASTVQVASTGTISAAWSYTSFFSLPSTGSITTAVNFNAETPSFSSTGSITNMYGLSVSNLGHATLVGTAAGVRIHDQTASATAARGLWSSLSAGTGKHNLYIDGTAPNLFGGPLHAAHGSPSEPSFAFSAQTNSGIWADGGGGVHISCLGTDQLQVLNPGIATSTSISMGPTVASPDVWMRRTASNTFSIATGSSTNRQFQVFHTANAVNYLSITGGVTGSEASISSGQSGDTNTGIAYATKGTGRHRFYTNGTTEQFRVTHTASAVNYLQATGGATGNPPSLTAEGSDPDIDVLLAAKGTGNVRFGTHTAIGAETVTGYITIKDSAGNIRKLAVVS